MKFDQVNPPTRPYGIRPILKKYRQVGLRSRPNLGDAVGNSECSALLESVVALVLRHNNELNTRLSGDGYCPL